MAQSSVGANTDAILDRIVHSSHRIALKGASLRKPEGQDQEEAQ